jgi:hypothetical protein
MAVFGISMKGAKELQFQNQIRVTGYQNLKKM